MATRIDKTISQNLDISSNPPALQSYLLRRSGRKFNDVRYLGLVRNNALSDVTDSGRALSNVLEYITKIDDATEIQAYGNYTPEDFQITREFYRDGITQDFLTPLKDVSIAGGSAGSVVLTTPRLRIEDRINQINNLTGKGTLDDLHAGPTAIFYRVPAGIDQEFGTLKLTSFNITTGDIGGFSNVTITSHQDLYEEQLQRPDDIVWTLKSYFNPATNTTVSLDGNDIRIRATVTGEAVVGGQTVYTRGYKTDTDEAKDELVRIRQSLGNTAFLNLVYVFSREYSVMNPPQWFLESPADSSNSVAYSADDINPSTSLAVLETDGLAFNLYSEKEYFWSGNYVETRVIIDDRDVYYPSTNIVKDSNMRFLYPPRVLAGYDDNWGVRWDGYLRLDNNGTDLKYMFVVETNSAVKIDIVNGGTNANPTWTEVFNSFDPTKKLEFYDNSDDVKRNIQVSKTSFNLDNIPDKFVYKLDAGGSKSYRYVPISIRMWNGQADKADETVEVPNEPDLFIKTGSSSSQPNSISKFYADEIVVNLTESSGTLYITPNLTFEGYESDIDLVAIINDPLSSVYYEIIGVERTVTTVTGVDPNTDQPITSTANVIVPISPQPVTLDIPTPGGPIRMVDSPTDGSIPLIGTDIVTFNYVLRIAPRFRDTFSLRPLWSARIVPPKDNYGGYADLLDLNYEPIIYKYDFDLRPLWWKASDGQRYLPDLTASKTNDPLDGFVNNYFATVLSSKAPNITKYGDGTGATYPTRKNMILGDAKFPGGSDSSNYVGMRFTPNLLGEGGVVKFTGIPINNALFEWSGSGADAALGVNDLGGGSNHLTVASGQVTVRSVAMKWQNTSSPGDSTNGNAFYTDDLTTVTFSDVAENYGFPQFSDHIQWAKPITIDAVSFSNNQTFDSVSPNFVTPFAAPVTFNVERRRFRTSPTRAFIADSPTSLGANEIWLLRFSCTHPQVASSTNGIGTSLRYVRYYTEKDLAFRFTKVDTGESISYSDVLKITYDPTAGFLSSLSEVPKSLGDRITPFGQDDPTYSKNLAYPPYDTNDILLAPTVRSDADLYNTSLSPVGNYDVFWGDHTDLATLGGNRLDITEKIEFSYLSSDAPNIITTSSKLIDDLNYTHKLKIELPLFKPGGGSYDEDVYIHIGNQEAVKDTYYLFVNGRTTPGNSASAMLPGL